MRLHHSICFLCLAILSLTAIAGCTDSVRSSKAENPTVMDTNKQECLNQEEFSKALEAFETGTSTDGDRAKQRLLEISGKSYQCRGEIIRALVKAMDQPNVDFRSDPRIFHVWRYGGEILGDLKAVEALDLLISHLSRTGWTFSTSMKHQPALKAVIKIGEPAIPKLDEVLRQHSDVQMRHSAVYCIASIGGPAAVQTLKNALPLETDKCVSRFIRISLESFDKAGKITNRGTWFSGGMCD
jgi:hypothetical protein